MTLRSYTIVPRELYVPRRADAQLNQIIADMGRPGYVLVARQMGKTNLLLNAKRNSAPSDLFVYLDVSNIFPDERGFFRNIIDVALESLKEAAVFLNSTIEQERMRDQPLPHKEHERELRRVIQNIQGKLIICLDEIDALTKTSYSDQIFSFIRSIYFSGRANIAEFDRLTYILSGVAEPSDLIKNKSISPFNIGEKIYLDDFTFAEFEDFLSRAQISLPLPVCERIFLWTNGHPRMTWDLVSEIEKRPSIDNLDEIDAIVRELYFGSVDIPPVDHVKALVESSREVKDALIAMHYGKAAAISEGVRTKLYLAGISRFDTESREASFKNKVLELALSEDFLNSIDQQQPSYEIAIKNLNAKLYSDAFIGFNEVLKQQSEDSRAPLAQYWAGVCCYHLGKYREAISYFSVSNSKLPVTSIISRYYFQGMSHLLLGEPKGGYSFTDSSCKRRRTLGFSRVIL
jgi:tetratricopeptide (TPR) repeat protein